MKSKSVVIAAFMVLLVVKGAYAQNQYNLPHVVNGNIGGIIYRTTFILFNNSNASVTAVLNLTDDNGNPLSVTLTPWLGTGSQFAINLDAGATGIFQTDGAGGRGQGAATLSSSGPIGVSAIFTVYDANGNFVSESGVSASDLLTDVMLPVDSTGFSLTGVAFFNPGGVDASLTLTLFNTDGSQAGSPTNLPLKSGNHTATFVAMAGQLFPTITNFRGTLRIQSTSPIAALVLRQYQSASTLSYTSLPVVPRSSTKLAINLAHIANGSYGSIGGAISFKTSFLIFNISSTPANVALTLTKDDGSPFIVTIPGTDTNSSFNVSLNAGASIFLQTDGLGTGASGAAIITSNVPIGASAIFTVLNSQGQFQTEAGVGDSPVSASLTLPVDFNGPFDTGVAFFNQGNGPLNLTLKLLDTNGTLLYQLPETLAAKNHLAAFVDQLFPIAGAFRGSLAVTATGSVAATTLRQYNSGATYTALPTVSGAAFGKAAVAALLPQTVTGIAASSGDPDVNISATLAPGFKLSGMVSGPGQGLFVVASAGNNVFTGSVNPLNSKYLVVVPAGTYSLQAWYIPAGVGASSGTVMVTYADPAAVQVSGDATRDIMLPPVTLTSVSGTISGLNSLPSGAATTVVFTSNDNTMQGQFTPDASGHYQGVLPAGSYVASVSRAPIQLLPLQTETLQLYNLGSLTVAGSSATGNYTIPATVKLSGIVGGGGFLVLPSPTSVIATDTSAPAISQIACCAPAAASTGTADPSSGQYRVVLAQNRSYTVIVSAQIIQTTTMSGWISYPLSPSAMSLSADTSLNFNIPTLPGRASFFGRVTDGLGNGIPNVVVTASTQSTAPNVGFTATGTTDSNGNYSIGVLYGFNYRVSFVPPFPKP